MSRHWLKSGHTTKENNKALGKSSFPNNATSTEGLKPKMHVIGSPTSPFSRHRPYTLGRPFLLARRSASGNISIGNIVKGTLIFILGSPSEPRSASAALDRGHPYHFAPAQPLQW